MKILADIATCEDGRDKILSVYQGTTSPMGKTMFTLIGAMVELESSLISERVSAGMKAAKARALGPTATADSCRGEDRDVGEDDEFERARDSAGDSAQKLGAGWSETSSNVPAIARRHTEVIEIYTHPEQTRVRITPGPKRARAGGGWER